MERSSISSPRSPSSSPSSSPRSIRFPRRYLRSTTTIDAMPSRKSQSNSSETASESRRESLRRLSSLTSLHLLNPFARRRSNNTADNSPSTQSHASLSSSTIAEAPEHQRNHSTAQLFGEHNDNDIGTVPPPPIPSSQWPARKSSYVCLPDDPIGGMPRSRTFSNLPLPTRARKSNNPLVQSKSHARLPSLTQPKSHTRLPSIQSKSHTRLPSAQLTTRLPSPILSNRKYSGSRLPLMESRGLPEKRRLPRSDTMPLLGGHERDTSYHRSTAFKENISLSPIKPLSALDLLDEERMYGSTFAPASYDSNKDWFENENPRFGRHQSSHQLSSVECSSAEGDNNSPLYRSTRQRPGTPGQGQIQGVQRWQSQPMLTNNTNARHSHGEIRQTRLMSARQAPTPPPPRTPVAKQLLNSSSNLRLVSHASDHVRAVSEKLSPNRMSQTGAVRSRGDSIGQRSSLNSHPNVKPENLILQAEPVGYWTGRFSTLNDRYRNEELIASLPTAMDVVRESSPQFHVSRSSAGSSTWPSKNSTDKMHTPEANTARMRRAVVALYALCGNDEARDSFSRWQAQLAIALSNPELGRPVRGSGKMSGCQLEMRLREDESTPGGSSRVGSSRKMSFMEKILGRRKGSAFGIGVGA